MPRRPDIAGRPWPRLMRAATAAAYVDEVSVDAFLRRAGTVYPAGRHISGRGTVWRREDLDQSIDAMGERHGMSLADDL